MGFRGCDGKFGKGLENAAKHPEGFGSFVNQLVAGMKKRKKQIEENSELFLDKYGIKYCPFHFRDLAEDVVPDSMDLRVKGITYKFHTVKCSGDKLCKNYVSFDSDLFSTLADRKLKEIDINKNHSCVTCGGIEARAYLTGFRAPFHVDNPSLKKSQEYLNDMPVLIFERDCGHNYTVLKGMGTPKERLK